MNYDAMNRGLFYDAGILLGLFNINQFRLVIQAIQKYYNFV